jgi:hypothetical protein
VEMRSFQLYYLKTIRRQEESVTCKGTSSDEKVLLVGSAKKSLRKTGQTGGTDAWIEQMKDKTVKPARCKKVTLSDRTVSKNIEGPLTDPSLHRHQKKETQ